MKIRYLLAAALSAVTSVVFAQNDNPMYMVMTLSDGTLKVVDVELVDRITFGASSLKATDKTGATVAELPLSSLSSIEFNEEGVAALNSVTTGESTIFYEPQSAMLRINDAKGDELSIYDLNGNLLLSMSITNSCTTVDISQLASGLYLVKLSDTTLKISKK